MLSCARRSGLLAALGCALAAIVVAGCGSSAKNSSESKSGTSEGTSGVTTIKFGLTSENMLYAPYVVAQEQGFFKKNHINLSLVLTKEAATAEAAVATGATPIGAIATGTIALGHAKEPEVAIMQPVVKGTPYSLMVNPKYKTPASLKGQALAASAIKTADGAIIGSMLAHYGLKEGSDYTILVAGSPADRTASLLNGKSAGLATPEPELSLLESKGFRQLIKASEIPGLAEQPFTMIATTRSWAKAHPQLVIDFQKAWLEGVKYLYETSHEAELVSALAKVFEVEPSVMKKAYQDWMVEQKVYSESCEVPVSGLKLAIEATAASGELTGSAPSPESLLLGGEYCSKATQ